MRLPRYRIFLLPSIGEWLPEKHLGRFVVEVIDGLDLSSKTRRYWGSETASYHPALLLCCWGTAIRRGCFRARSWNVRPISGVPVHHGKRASRPRHDRDGSAAISVGDRRADCAGAGAGARDGLAEAGDGRRRDASGGLKYRPGARGRYPKVRIERSRLRGS
jgi:hypothetical protein